MRPRPGRLALLLGGPLLVLALSTCALGPPVEVTATDPPRTAPAPEEPAFTATDPPRRVAEAPAPEPPPPAEPAAPADPVAPAEPAAPAQAPPAVPAPPPVVEPPAPVASEAPVEVAGVPEPTRVVVPRIGVDNPLVPVGLHPDRTLVVPDQAQVAGWYTGAPRPGRTGPAVLTGHNSWNGQRGVFWDLHRLVPGDVIEVHHHDGQVVRFAVDRVEQHAKTAFPSERVYGSTDRREVRIITCGGAFDQSARSHVDNIIVFGHRIH